MCRPIGASAQGWPARRPTELLKKEPVIGDGSQSREDLQGKSIRGSVMCRNSHTRWGNACGSGRWICGADRFWPPHIAGSDSRRVAQAAGICAEGADDWAVQEIPEKHSATERNIIAGSAAYPNWAIKSPSRIMSTQTRERFKRKRPRRGAGGAGVGSRMTLVAQPSRIPAHD